MAKKFQSKKFPVVEQFWGVRMVNMMNKGIFWHLNDVLNIDGQRHSQE